MQCYQSSINPLLFNPPAAPEGFLFTRKPLSCAAFTPSVAARKIWAGMGTHSAPGQSLRRGKGDRPHPHPLAPHNGGGPIIGAASEPCGGLLKKRAVGDAQRGGAVFAAREGRPLVPAPPSRRTMGAGPSNKYCTAPAFAQKPRGACESRCAA